MSSDAVSRRRTAWHDEPFCRQKFEPSFIIRPSTHPKVQACICRLESCRVWTCQPLPPPRTTVTDAVWDDLQSRDSPLSLSFLVYFFNLILPSICQVQLQLIFLKLHLTNGFLQVGWVQHQWIPAVAFFHSCNYGSMVPLFELLTLVPSVHKAEFLNVATWKL